MAGSMTARRPTLARIAVVVAGLLVVALVQVARPGTAQASATCQLHPPLIYSSNAAEGESAGFIVRNTDGTCKQLLPTGGVPTGVPQFSPDGRYIYWTFHGKLYRVDGWGGTPVTVGDYPWDVIGSFALDYGSGGCKVAAVPYSFTDSHNTHYTPGVYWLNPDCTLDGKITDTAEGALSGNVSYRNGQVAFSLRNASGGTDVRSVDIDENGRGTNPQNLTPDDPTSTNDSAQFTPDQQCLSWVHRKPGEPTTLYQQCPGDSGPVALGQGASITNVSYSPDGCFVTWMNGGSLYGRDICHGARDCQIVCVNGRDVVH